MPEADGYTLIQKVRTRATERGREIPALALTGYASTADGERIVAAGYHAYLTKPIEATDLVAAVARLAGMNAKP
jgi:CheY-like chemotaxis protein